MSRREKAVCSTCGRLAYCEDHHALGRAHVPDVTVPACGVCHPVLNERQAIAGMVRDHAVDRAEGEAFWAFASGLTDVLVLRGLSSIQLHEQELERQQLAVTTLGRMLDLVLRASDRPGIAGPNPRKTDLRIAGRRKSRNRDRSHPHRPPPAHDPSTDFERSAQLAQAVDGAIGSVPHGDLFADLAASWSRFVARLPNAHTRLVELAARGRESDLFECLREGARRLEAGTAALAGVERVEDVPGAWSGLSGFDAFFSDAMMFLDALIHAETADQAERALDVLHAAAFASP